MARLHIGTSGWTYRHWAKRWYAGVPSRLWLEHCAGKFTGLEANGTFYRLPKTETLEDWARRTPEDFCFAIKAHRFLTHRKKLLDVAEGIQRQREPALGLGRKLGCVVWQLPSSFTCDIARLESFAEELAAWPEPRHALEFRHESWFNDEVAAVLEKSGLASVISDASRWRRWDLVTSNLAYVRLHGAERTYFSGYGDRALAAWAEKVASWLDKKFEVHVYFDNDAAGHAPHDAMRLIEMVAGSPGVG